MMHLHRIVIDQAKSVYLIECQCPFLNKFNTAFHTNLFAALQCVCPQCLNRVSRRLKRIGEEETRYHKPFFFQFKRYSWLQTEIWTLVQVM